MRPCATHVFNGAHLLALSPCAETITQREPCTRDFFDRFTCAQLVAPDLLALCYETGQRWSDFGSFGDRMKNMQICSVSRELETLFCWWDTRQFDEDFEPSALAFASPGRFALSTLREPRVVEARALRDNWTGLPEITDAASEHWLYQPLATRLTLHNVEPPSPPAAHSGPSRQPPVATPADRVVLRIARIRPL